MKTVFGRPLQIALRNAIDNPLSWDVQGLLTDAADNLDELHAFLRTFLNPDERGLAVPAHVRDDVRELLGMKRCETNQ